MRQIRGVRCQQKRSLGTNSRHSLPAVSAEIDAAYKHTSLTCAHAQTHEKGCTGWILLMLPGRRWLIRHY